MKFFPARSIDLAMQIAARSALLGIPGVSELMRDYNLSRATAYRYWSSAKRALYTSAAAKALSSWSSAASSEQALTHAAIQ
jgi:hypothetical protein